MLKLDEKFLGPEHPETLFSGMDLANVRWASPMIEPDSLAEVRRVLKLREKVLGPEHPETIFTRFALTNGLAGLGEFSEAISQLREAG